VNEAKRSDTFDKLYFVTNGIISERKKNDEISKERTPLHKSAVELTYILH